MAKIGYLCLRRGECAGQQILLPDRLDAISHATIDMHLHRKSAQTNFSVRAVKGSCAIDFQLHFQFLGQGEQRRWSLRFDDEKVTSSGGTKDGRNVAIDGALGGWSSFLSYCRIAGWALGFRRN